MFLKVPDVSTMQCQGKHIAIALSVGNFLGARIDIWASVNDGTSLVLMEHAIPWVAIDTYVVEVIQI